MTTAKKTSKISSTSKIEKGIEVQDLKVHYDTPDGVVKAVDGVSFSLRQGERMALVGSVASAILASVGLEALGLGPFDSPTLGMTIYWNIQFSSILHGMWWWFGPPILVLAMIFVGLFLMTAGLDEWSNPRLRKRV